MSKKFIPESGGRTPSYWWLEDVVARRMNRLKAKIFNLIEASVVDKTQQEALKGLIKGFANDEYRDCLVDMRQEAREAKFLPEEKDSQTPPLSAYPLETIALHEI